MFVRILIFMSFILFPIVYSNILKGNESYIKKKISWIDKEKRIFVLKNRVHKKEERFSIWGGILKELITIIKTL